MDNGELRAAETPINIFPPKPIYKQTYLGSNRAYNMGTPENPKADDKDGYADLIDFQKYHPNAEVIGVFQEQTGADIHRKFYIYRIFFKEYE